MPRAIWKGSISFGLVNIPVGLFSATSTDEMSFRQLDKRDMQPIGYRKYNKSTGDEVESELIVKGYEYDPGRYVVVSDDDLRRANPEKTQTVEITDFVDRDEIAAAFYDKPYYLGPLGKSTSKGYALLREAMRRSGKVGIAKVVIRSREYLCAVVPQDDVLLLEILRYPAEIRAADDLNVPGDDLDALGVKDREIKMAEALIEGMTAEWNPEQYHDTYREDLMGLIKSRIESGQTDVPDDTPVEDAEPREDVIDIMALLKRSVEAAGKDKPAKAEKDEADDAAAEDDDDTEAKKAAKPRSTAPSRPRAKRKTA